MTTIALQVGDLLSILGAQGIEKQLMRKDPHLTVSIAQRAWPFPQSFMARLGDALQAAGLPRA